MSKARLVITAVVMEGRRPAEVARTYGVARSWVVRSSPVTHAPCACSQSTAQYQPYVASITTIGCSPASTITEANSKRLRPTGNERVPVGRVIKVDEYPSFALVCPRECLVAVIAVL